MSLGYNRASVFADAPSPLAIGLMTADKPAIRPNSLYVVSLALITIVSVHFAAETPKIAET